MQPTLNGRSYFFIDGSALFNHIEYQWKDKKFSSRKLKINIFSEYLRGTFNRYANMVIRVNFYFRQGDERLGTHLNIPESTTPGNKDHWEIIECGNKNTIFPESTIKKIRSYLPKKWQVEFNYMIPKEKGVDMELSCDALTLVANGKAENIILYINDSDFMPLIQACKSLGANVYIASLSKNKAPQQKLTDISDAYLALDPHLESIFEANNVVE